MENLILNNITKAFDNHLALQEINLTLEAGSFIALLGPSGCGKTTLLRMIAGFEEVTQGEIIFNNKVLSSKSVHIPPEQREINMVFQSYALWPHMNVADNVGYSLKLKGTSKKERQYQVHEALSAVNLQHLSRRMPNELSGGQRQRVALARCLISSPKIVLLDEPLANLDQHLRASMEQTFRDFQRKTKACFIYVTHDQSEAMAMADKIAVLNQGRIEQFDTPEELYQHPKSEWVARFIGKGSIITLPNDKNHRYLVRPQHICVSKEGIPARIITRIYKGGYYAYTAEIYAQQTILFLHEQVFAEGTQIHLTLTHYHPLKLTR